MKRKHQPVDRWVDISAIPHKIYCGRDCLDYEKAVGQAIPFRYGTIWDVFEICRVYKEPGQSDRFLDLRYQGKIKKHMRAYDVFQKCALGGLVGYHTHEFKLQEGQEVKDAGRELRILRAYRNEKKKKCVDYLCLTCGTESRGIPEESVLRGNGCGVCDGKRVVPGVNDIMTTAPWMAEYFPGGAAEAARYTRTSQKRINFCCPACGRIRRKKLNIYTLYHKRSIGCVCRDGVSYPERFTACFFEAVGQQDYRRQVTPGELWGGREAFRYDGSFQKDGKQYLVEIHGAEHYTQVKFGNGEVCKSLESVQENDRKKKLLAEKHGIVRERYVELDCRVSTLKQMKKAIRTSALASLFAKELKTLDWEGVETKARKSLWREILRMAEENPDMSTRKIAESFSVCQATVAKVLKAQGGYDKKEQLRRRDKSFYRENRRQIVSEIEEYIRNHAGCRIEDVALALGRCTSGVYQICRAEGLDISRCRENSETYRKEQARMRVVRPVQVVTPTGQILTFSSQTEAIRELEQKFSVKISQNSVCRAVKLGCKVKGFAFQRLTFETE